VQKGEKKKRLKKGDEGRSLRLNSQRWLANCDGRLTSQGKFAESGFWGFTAASANDERTEMRCVPLTRKTLFV